MRCLRRRNEATERSRTSSADSAVTTRQAAAALLAPARGAAWSPAPGARRRRAAPRRCAELPLRRLRASVRARRSRRLRGRRGALRRTASWRLRRLCAWCLRRACGALLRRACALRRLRARLRSMLFAALPDPRFFLGDLALFGFAQARVGERVGARAALFLGQRAQHDARRLRRRGRGRRRGSGAGGDGALRRGAARARPAPARLRLRLARPGDAALHLLDNDRLAAAMAEALAHDALLDAAALERQRLGRGDAQLLAAIFVRLSHSRSCLRPVSPRRSISGLMLLIAGAKPLQAPATREKSFARRSGKQGCMYHIWAVQCQIQLRRRSKIRSRRRFRPTAGAALPAIELAHPVGGRVARHEAAR